MSPEAPQGSWRIAGCSVRGTSHEQANLPCQDVLAWKLLPQGLLAVAMADGAGSATLAEVGARLAVETALSTLEATLAKASPPSSKETWEPLLRQAMQASRDRLKAEAELRAQPLRELAATLVLAVAGPDSFACGQVGDGTAIFGDAESPLQASGVEGGGEYLNETTFLTAEDALERVRVGFQDGPARRIALLTDGLQMLALKMSDRSPHLPFFQPLFRFVEGATDLAVAQEQLAAFLRSPRITSRADDDLTLFLAVWRPA